MTDPVKWRVSGVRVFDDQTEQRHFGSKSDAYCFAAGATLNPNYKYVRIVPVYADGTEGEEV